MKRKYLSSEDIVKKMVGLTPISVTGCREGSEEMIVTMSNGNVFCFYHSQNCCETVGIAQVDGDVDDLLELPLALAEEVTGDTPSDYTFDYKPESFTWTFYRFATTKGYVNVRWLGTSNGYYSESVTVTFNEKDHEDD